MNGTTATATPVVTGIGVVAPTGIGVEPHWQAVLAGKSGISRISRFDASGYPVRVAGQVPGFVAAERLPGRLIPQTDHWTHLGLAAVEAALDDGAVNPADLPEYEMAVVTASSSGGTEFGQHEMERLYQKGPSWVGAYQSIAWFYAATTGQVSIRHGMRGPCGVFCGEQAGGLDALGQARRLVRRGSRLVVTGGTDASLCPYGLVAQLAGGRLSTVDDVARAYLPFDVDASGYLPGEGGAMLIVESAAAAEERGADGYATLAGYAAGFDPPPGSSRPPALRRIIERALVERVAAGPVQVRRDVLPGLDQVEVEVVEAEQGPPGHADQVRQLGRVGLGEGLRDGARVGIPQFGDDQCPVHGRASYGRDEGRRPCSPRAVERGSKRAPRRGRGRAAVSSSASTSTPIATAMAVTAAAANPAPVRIPAPGARPAPVEARMNTVIPTRNRRLRPYRSPSRPPVISVSANPSA